VAVQMLTLAVYFAVLGALLIGIDRLGARLSRPTSAEALSTAA
jgi:hypothetical protein